MTFASASEICIFFYYCFARALSVARQDFLDENFSEHEVEKNWFPSHNRISGVWLKGCVRNGIYHESETEWTEGTEPCKIFTCKAGVITESRLHCYTPCSKPIPAAPGQCCPVCVGKYHVTGRTRTISQLVTGIICKIKKIHFSALLVEQILEFSKLQNGNISPWINTNLTVQSDKRRE